MSEDYPEHQVPADNAAREAAAVGPTAAELSQAAAPGIEAGREAAAGHGYAQTLAAREVAAGPGHARTQAAREAVTSAYTSYNAGAGQAANAAAREATARKLI